MTSGVLDTVPGRVTLRVRVPRALVEDAGGIAAATGQDLAVVLGDLVASALPDALAEAAADLLALDAASSPALVERAR